MLALQIMIEFGLEKNIVLIMMQIQNGGGMHDCSTAHPGGNNGFDLSNVVQALER